MFDKITECKSETGITVGLIDSIMTSATVAAERLQRATETEDYLDDEIVEACADLFQHGALRFLISFGGNRTYESTKIP